MERKKLYKAKKNWVIGLATGLAIMALGTNIAYADNNTSNEPVVTTQQANASTQQTTNQQEQVNVQPENTIGMSSNVASNPIGSYNKDNVGYINPNTEIDVYNNQPTHHLSHQGSYKYPYKLLDKFAQKDDLLKKNMYGTPDVYEYLGDSNNPYKNVKPKQITDISSTDTNITHYYNNGVSNAINFPDTQGDLNYEAINNLSQALSYADYKMLTDIYSQPRNDQNYGRFFDGNKPIITPSPVLSTQDLDALYKVAYKNRPIITFDGWSKSGHHITSFLQASISSVNDGWNLTFDNGWRGYTFMDGRQIAFVETNKTRGILRNKGKNFSWKNTVLKYFAESLAYKNSVAEEVDQNTPYMLVGRNYIPVTDILTSRTLNRLENPFNVSPTEIIFAKNGVYAIINGAMGGYNPILVQVPMAFLKSEFQAFYGTNEEPTPPNHHSTNTDKSDDNTVDIDKLDKEYISNSYNGIFKDAGDASAAGLTIGKEKGWFSKDKEGLVGIAKKFISFAGNLTKDLGHSLSNVLSDAEKFGAGIADEFVNVWKDKISKGNSFFAKILKEGTKVGTYTRRFGIASAVFDTGSLGSKLFKMHEDSKKDKKDLNKAASVRKQDFKKERKNMLDTIKSSLTVALDAVSAVPGAVAISAAVVGLALPFLALGIYKVLNNDTKYLAKFRLRRKK